MSPNDRKAATQLGSPPYRVALLFMAVASVPFAFLNRPLLIVIAFTVLGSLFIPFLAATLLYLNTSPVILSASWSFPRRRKSCRSS